jgi:hypothetical protein
VRSSDNLYRFTATAAAATAGLVLSSSLAYATGGGEGGEGYSHGYGDSAQIEISGEIPATCTFTTTPNVTSIGQMATNNVTPLGSLGFTCNMAMSSSVCLTVKAQTGKLKRVGGSETVDYQVAWTFPSGSDVFQTLPTNATQFTLLTNASGVERLGTYKVKVTGPTAGKAAGYYKDIVTYTISP